MHGSSSVNSESLFLKFLLTEDRCLGTRVYDEKFFLICHLKNGSRLIIALNVKNVMYV